MCRAEGLLILTEAAEAGHLPRYLVHAPDAAAHPLVRRLATQTEASGGEVIETSRDILHNLSGKDNPQAVLGVYDEFVTALTDIDRSKADIWFVAQSLRDPGNLGRSEEHTSELQSLMRISYAVFCLKKKRTHLRRRLHTLNKYTKTTIC